jgi:hypothetical protein
MSSGPATRKKMAVGARRADRHDGSPNLSHAGLIASTNANATRINVATIAPRNSKSGTLKTSPARRSFSVTTVPSPRLFVFPGPAPLSGNGPHSPFRGFPGSAVLPSSL